MRVFITPSLAIVSTLGLGRRLLSAGLVLAMTSPVLLFGQDYEGFLEPIRRVDIASQETGVLDKVNVKEGDLVVANQIVAEMNCDVLIATLRAAEKARDSRGKLNAAEIEIKDRTRLLEKISSLREKGHSTQQELEQAELKKAIAEAQLVIVQDELAVRSLESKRIEAEIERRKLRSPINGVVVEILKDQGELVATNDAQVLTIVQLDPLVCVFPVHVNDVRNMKSGQTVKIQVGEISVLEGTVEFRSPLVDPQTGTTKIKILVPNPTGKLSSGDRCRLLVDGKPRPTTATNDNNKKTSSPGQNNSAQPPTATNIFGEKIRTPTQPSPRTN